MDCLDGSDEDDCNLVIVDWENYRKQNKPHPIRGESSLGLKLWLEITNIDSIRELKGDYRVQFHLSVRWHDSRVMFQNLKENLTHNMVDWEISRHLWIPPLNFPNSFGDNRIMDDEHTYLLVNKNSDATFATEEDIHENYFFNGTENELVYYRRFQLTHQCSFELHYFPFDTQYCKIEVSAYY